MHSIDYSQNCFAFNQCLEKNAAIRFTNKKNNNKRAKFFRHFVRDKIQNQKPLIITVKKPNFVFNRFKRYLRNI